MPSDDIPLRILTLNLFSGRADADDLCSKIESLKPDLLCVQELSFELAGRISELMPAGILDPDPITRGLGIASLRPVDTERVSIPKRDAWAARLDPEHWPQLSAPVEIINWHVMGPHTWPYFPNTNTRKGQLQALRRHLGSSPEMACAVLGDYNASPAWPLYKSMKEDFDDALVSPDLGASTPRPTWPYLPAVGIKGWFRIDHCFTSGFDCRQAHTVSVTGTDHLGLLVDLVPRPTPNA